MNRFRMGRTQLLIPSALVAAVAAAGTLWASTQEGPRVPTDFQRGYLVNSMLVTKEPNKTGIVSGLHLIYVNRAGLERLKRGGSTSYPDGTVLTDDVRNFSVDDGVYRQGDRKAITVMVKDSKKYASTGGWGFQAWIGGDLAKPIVNDAPKQCYACHRTQKGNDAVFSTYLK